MVDSNDKYGDISMALRAKCEVAKIDFKSNFKTDSAGEWLEIIKDLVAMANTGGGTILIGVSDDGSPSGADITPVVNIDPADITNKIYKYTGIHFHSFEIIECKKGDADVCAIEIGPTKIPIVFTKVGSYEASPGKQKTAFSGGMVYFRHGAKSEPGNSEDLRDFLDREIEATKKSWLDGIAKVVEAPTGSRVAILPPADYHEVPLGTVPLRLTNDPTAPEYYALPIDTTHPFRQKEVVREVNNRLDGRKTINSHHIVCIRRVYSIQKNIQFCYTQNYASPRYNQGFVDWIVGQYESNTNFFEDAKEKFDEIKNSGAKKHD